MVDISVENLETPEADFWFLKEPKHPIIARFLTYWTEKCGTRAYPDRADILPADIVPLLPHISIHEVVDGGKDFRARIFGTAIVELVGEERTGMLISEFGYNANPPTQPYTVQRHWMDCLQTAYKEARPVLVGGRMSCSQRPYIIWHGISCPLSNGGSEIQKMIGVLLADHSEAGA